jgi:F0F1-type ATP synthase membrane subunit c/vacuolar-type H+-ATPase subunit K
VGEITTVVALMEARAENRRLRGQAFGQWIVIGLFVVGTVVRWIW